ncbi:fungal-specific transcription factor domain-containing protein [Mycena rebaudengoi]|nr:fungal-specific transcription factor domain-containing protein [Mycena rebaudengoi]
MHPSPDSRSQSRIRKVDRACDACRRRKTKCDGPKMKDNVCSNCVHSLKPCTYLEASTPRGPPKAYITGLEDRLERLEQLLKQMSTSLPSSVLQLLVVPGKTRTLLSPRSPVPHSCTMTTLPPGPVYAFSTHLALDSHSRHTKPDSDSDYASSDSEQMVEGLVGGMRKFTLRRSDSRPEDPLNDRFHGKSSMLSLIDATRRYKDLHVSETREDEQSTDPSSSHDAPESYAAFKRPEFWLAPPWEDQWEGLEVDAQKLLVSVLEEFPPIDLTTELIDLYFCHCNAQLPLLHRPTFERQFKDKRHHHNIWFACVCLCMFAVASRWSNNPLVLPRNCARTSTGGLDWRCSGWHYHNVAFGIHRLRKSLLYPASLEEIQTFTLLAMFIRGTANHPAAWLFTSIGIRKAQDIGAHRKKVYGKKPTVEEELWKRAFWSLVAYDRFSSAILGRPCAGGEDDFDLDLPLEVDDEFWESETPFYQPPGTPCRITFFNLWLKISQIITYTVQTIYAVHNPRALLGRIAKVRTEEVVAQLTAALRDWKNSLPDYLRWPNDIQDEQLSNQSATLNTTYYLAEMLVFRAFIPPIATPAPAPPPQLPKITSAMPALAICTRAARASTRIIEVQLARPGGWTNIPTLIAVSQLSAAILTLGVWDLKTKQQRHQLEDIKPPLAHTIAALMDDISILIGALEWTASRWEHVAALLRVLKASLPKSESETQPSAADTHPPPSPIPSAFQPDNPTGVSWSPHYPSSSVRTHLAQPDVQKDLAVGKLL